MTDTASPTASSSHGLAATENLWERAIARLREKDKAWIVSNTIVSLEDILSTIEKNKQICESKRLIVRRGPDKDPIVLRDVFSKIAGWIEKFVAVGDTVVQYDPGHAALPWAAISVQDVRRYASLPKGLENISKIITRCTIMESLYFSKQIRTTEQAKNTTVDLYATILSFLAKAKRYSAKGTLRKTFGSIGDFDNNFESILKKIDKEEVELQRYTGLMDTECREANFETMGDEQKIYDKNLRTLLSDIQKPIDRIDKHLQIYQDNLEEAERIQILQWLSPIPYLQHHGQANGDVLRGTGQWLVDDDRLLEWQFSQSSSILWLHGIPGSGKTKLVSILVESLLKRFNDGKGSCPAFFYCTRNPAEPERASPEAILRSIVRQLSCPNGGQLVNNLSRNAHNAWKQNAGAAGSLSLKESVSMIVQLNELAPMTFIIIDALDECNRQERQYLLDGLSKIVKDSTGTVKIFVSSREEMEILDHLDGCPNVQIGAKNNQSDIEFFVNSEVGRLIQRKKLLRGDVPPKLRQRIEQVLCEQAQGMFRWVSLQLQYLSTIRVAGLVEKRLGKLPQELGKIYEEAYTERFSGYQDEEKALVHCALRWLLCSQEPLKTKTFLRLTSSSSYQEAIEDLSRDALLDLCFNFIVHDAELDVFRFAHLSVREYLETVDSYQLEASHAFAAGYCLNILMFKLNIKPHHDSLRGAWKNFTEFQIYGPNVIVMYAHLYWGHHIKMSGQHRAVDPLLTFFSEFTGHQRCVSPYFSHWNQCLSSTADEYLTAYGNMALSRQEGHSMRSAFKLALSQQERHSRLDALKQLECLLSDPADTIFTASYWDFEELMERRIKLNWENLNVTNRKKVTALHLACKKGSSKVARLLIEQGVDLEARSGGLDSAATALMLAVSEDHTGIVQVLLENHADPWAGNFTGKSALELAGDLGSTAMTNLMIDLRAGANGFNEKSVGFNHLVMSGHTDVVDALYKRTGRDIVSRQRWVARTNLMRVIRNSGDVTRMFERHGAEDFTDRETLRAALFTSLQCNNVNAGRGLIAMGADVNSKIVGFGDNWWTKPNDVGGSDMLLNAIMTSNRRDTAFVELLLESGALVNLDPSTHSMTPLQVAVTSDEKAVVTKLLDKNVQLDFVNYHLYHGSEIGRKGSILDVAENKGHFEIAQQLKERGCVSAISEDEPTISRQVTSGRSSPGGVPFDMELAFRNFHETSTQLRSKLSDIERNMTYAGRDTTLCDAIPGGKESITDFGSLTSSLAHARTQLVGQETVGDPKLQGTL